MRSWLLRKGTILSEIEKATKGKPASGLSKEESAQIFMDTFKALQVDEKMVKVFQAIREERQRQNEKWGDQSNISQGAWNLILVEEVGEVAKCILDCHYAGLSAKANPHNSSISDGPGKRELIMELTQVAAVTVAWLEALSD